MIITIIDDAVCTLLATRYKIIFHQKEFTTKLQNHIKIYRFMKIYSNLLALNIPHLANDSPRRIALTVYTRY